MSRISGLIGATTNTAGNSKFFEGFFHYDDITPE